MLRRLLVFALVSTSCMAGTQSLAPSGQAYTDLGASQLQIADNVHFGQISCDEGWVVIYPDYPTYGRFTLDFRNRRYTMTPVVTTNTVVRLEDFESGVVWIQVANKSMLLDQRAGSRLADGCVHPAQASYQGYGVKGLLD